MADRLRIAMVLPEPRVGGGVPGTGRLLAHALAGLGHVVDAYAIVDRPESVELLDAPGLHGMGFDTGWRWGRWYSQSSRPMVSHLTQLGSRAAAARALAHQLVAEHRRRPYDVVYRFSTVELFGLGGARDVLPPIVVHPEVHAAGELAAMRRERALARESESALRRWTAEALMLARVPRQRSILRSVPVVIAPSRVFAEHLARDCSVPRSRFHVVPNPVDLDAFSVATRAPIREGPWKLLFVGRISVRKGIDQLVELSHRLVDLAGRVKIDIAGGATLWSDYRPLLRGLNPAVAAYRGLVSHDALPQRLWDYDGLLQPSTYEPFAITVAEGLAAGLPVIASDEVGATEDVASRCCTVVPAGRTDELELAVRTLVERLDRGERSQMASAARAEAERLFAPERAGALVADALESAVRLQPSSYPVRRG